MFRSSYHRKVLIPPLWHAGGAGVCAMWSRCVWRNAPSSSRADTHSCHYCALAGLGEQVFMFCRLRSSWAAPSSLFSLNTLQAEGVYHRSFLLALVPAVLLHADNHLPVLETVSFCARNRAGAEIGLRMFRAVCCWADGMPSAWAVTFNSVDASQLKEYRWGVLKSGANSTSLGRRR